MWCKGFIYGPFCIFVGYGAKYSMSKANVFYPIRETGGIGRFPYFPRFSPKSVSSNQTERAESLRESHTLCAKFYKHGV